MASRKPAIGFGPITDDLAKLLIKGSRKGITSKKPAQVKRIVSILEKRGGSINKNTGEYITKQGAKANNMSKKYIKEIAPADTAYMNARKAKKAAATARSKAKKKTAIETGHAQRQIEINAANKKLNRKADRILNTIELADRRGAGIPTKNKRGKVTVLPKKAQGAQRSRAGAVGGGYKQANIRAKAKAEELTQRMRNASTPAERAKLRQMRRDHRDKTGF
jgi:hypothetical protein